MRWVGIFLGVSAALSGCATSETGVGGAGFGGVGGVGGLEGGVEGGGIGGNLAGSGGLAGSTAGGTGGSAGAGGAAGGAAGTPAGGAGGSGGGGTGATGGTGGSPCTPPVAGGLCDTLPQCGCPPGQACDVAQFTTGITQCGLAGNVPPYNACNGSTTKCQAGFACIGGACKSFCDTPANCSATSGDCLQVTYTPAGGTPLPVPEMKVCSKQCPLENPAAACGPTLNCYLTDQALGKTDCATGGTGIGAINCVADTTGTICAPGHVCLTSGECRKWCRVGTTTDCAAGKACTGFGTPLFVGPTQYGVCAL